MAHTVQSFVETLRADGVEAVARPPSRSGSRRRAGQAILGEAEAKARTIIEEAENERRRTLERRRPT